MNYPLTTASLAYSRYGDAEVLEIQSSRVQAPGPFSCLVQVKSISINPVDWKIMAGQQSTFTGHKPKAARIFGSDFCGVIVDTGPFVPTSLRGKRVMGMVNPLSMGSGSGFLEVRTSSLLECPDCLDDDQATALPAAGISALRLFRQRKAEWWKDRPVVLLGASGGVGHLLLQVLTGSGARICASSRRENHETLIRLGAQTCLDYREMPFIALLAGLSGTRRREGLPPALASLLEATVKKPVLVDCHGLSVAACLDRKCPHNSEMVEFLSAGGTWFPLSIANEYISRAVISMILPWRKGPAGLVLAIPSRKLLFKLASYCSEGTLEPLVDSVWSLQEAHKAISRSQEGHCLGKIIIRMNQA